LNRCFMLSIILPSTTAIFGSSSARLKCLNPNFANSMVLLEQAGNVKYKSFAAPGAQIEYCVKARSIEDNISSFTGIGTCGAEQVVEAKFGLRHFNLADEDPKMAVVDGRIIESMKQRFKLLKQSITNNKL